MKSKIIKVIAVISLVVVAFLAYDYNQANNTISPIHNIEINDLNIDDSKINYQVKYWGGYLEKEESINLINTIETTDSINEFLFDGEIISITINDNYEYKDNKIVFKQSGEYDVEITVANDDNSISVYNILFNVILTPSIDVSNLAPVQGELITINISNLSINDTLDVECEFSPSFIERNDISALFYIPINYQKSATTYPLNISINNITYSYMFEVQQYEFSKIYFTVSEEVTSSTVGDPNSGIEYRELIWPLYDTYSEEIYWDGGMSKPVEENRISSEFGQFRYINNSTTATRHSGIDYAADCGTEVVAAASGIVDIAYNLILSGNTVVIDHGLGLKSYYFHMQDLVVETGDFVEEGDLIGHVGMTGYATGCHLHFQTSIKNQAVNPELLYK